MVLSVGQGVNSERVWESGWDEEIGRRIEIVICRIVGQCGRPCGCTRGRPKFRFYYSNYLLGNVGISGLV